MGTYNIPRNLRGESRILYIFTIKALITTGIGAAFGAIFYLIFAMVRNEYGRSYHNRSICSSSDIV
jgi:hypothetical protein